MCGIVGIFNLNTEAALDPDRLKPSLDVLKPRGPDASGGWSGAGCAFGHRRLSILDLAGGKQPWTDEKQTPGVLTYNGELYNYRELRAFYREAGYQFRSNCDTEVVFAAWAQEGPVALTRFNGIFAFGYTDGKDRLWLVRDQAGVKPLYYTVVGGTLFFASTLAALMAFPEIPRQIDRVAAAHYLATARTNLGSRTLLKGVQILPPGHFLEIRRGMMVEALIPQEYWSLPALSPADKADIFGDAAKETCVDVLRASVQRQLQSDVPVGAFLSGGLDSSVLLALSREVQGAALGSYGVEFSDAPESEREGAYMRVATSALNTRFHGVQLRQSDFEPTWDFLLGETGQPLSTPNEVAIYHLARALREDYTVALGGEGADEVFAGYVLPYASAWDYARTREGIYSSVLRARVKDFYGRATFSHMAEHHLALNVWMRPHTVGAILGVADSSAWEPVEAFYRETLDRVAVCSPLDRYIHLHQRVNLEGLLLRLDSTTMAASVEGRVPFTDRDVMEWANTLPDQYLLRRADRTHMVPWRDNVAADWMQRGWLTGKWLLREAFRTQLPEIIVNRPKLSFPVPFQTELAAQSEDQRAWIEDSTSFEGVVDRSAVLQFWTETENPGDLYRRWPVINLLRWIEKWEVRG